MEEEERIEKREEGRALKPSPETFSAGERRERMRRVRENERGER